MQLRRIIGSDEDGKEIKKILIQGLKLSGRLIKRLRIHQGICVNGKPVFTNYICQEGDIVTIDLATIEPVQDVIPEYAELNILYEDEYILAVYKPEGMLTHPSRSQFEGTLMGFVLGYISKQDIPSCHAVNRLDRYTSGIVLFAKNAYAKSIFSSTMQKASKEYLAVVYGDVESKKGTIDLPIARLQVSSMLRSVSDDGARAVTHYELLQNANSLSVLRLKPETGRTHQLRVHCLAIGHPIIGDELYYTDESKEVSDRLEIQGQMLHAGRLTFVHPITKDV
jgi:23S rRNA pseudouridine1911/1915/1917 synthase